MFNVKGKAMAIDEIVQDGAFVFADAEAAAIKIKLEFRGLRKLFEGARDAGHIGALECQALASEADALATKFEADLWAMHRKLTLRAQELGIDLPTLRDGGDR